GKWDDPISCSLFVVSLDNKPKYTTLSYVWGDPNITEIFIDNVPWKVPINFFTVLKRIRCPDLALVVWIDAICIRQTDDKERSYQVALMGEIYSNAIATFVWIG
ncbi:HET-domain-containing protein, partial [Patellaria atrata CBS 101060]